MPRDVLSPKQENYLEWLCTVPSLRPDDQKTQNQWAHANGVSTSLPAQWKRLNLTFRRALKARFADLNQDPEKVQAVVEALHRAAVQGDVKAAMFYMQFSGDWVPSEKRIIETNTPSTLTDAELADELRSEADRLEAEAIMEQS